MTTTKPTPIGNRQSAIGNPAKRPRAKRIRAALGPYATSCTTFERGSRPIEIVRLTPSAIVYRLKGRPGEFTLPHEIGFSKALSIAADFDTGPRQGPIRRGS